jgi:hypothetical protein
MLPRSVRDNNGQAVETGSFCIPEGRLGRVQGGFLVGGAFGRQITSRAQMLQQAHVKLSSGNLHDANALCAGMQRIQEVVRGVGQYRRRNAGKRRRTSSQPIIPELPAEIVIRLPRIACWRADFLDHQLVRRSHVEKSIEAGQFVFLEFQVNQSLHHRTGRRFCEVYDPAASTMPPCRKLQTTCPCE